MNELQALIEAFNEAKGKGERCALATVVEVKGSAYRRAGARMLLAESGRSVGMINGGCLDGDLWAHSHEVMVTGKATLACYDTTAPDDIVFGLGLGCRGIVKILIEPVENLDWLAFGNRVEVAYEGETRGTRLAEATKPLAKGVFTHTIEAPLKLLIFGTGQDVVPLEAIARLSGFEIEVFDNRAPSTSRIPLLPSNHYPLEKLASHLDINSETACVIMTHNFLYDLELLKILLPSPAMYVGMLGPRRRADELLGKLGHETVLSAVELTEADMEKFHAPIGLDLGAETPEEIALSIVAEIQKVRRSKSGVSLREKGSIH